MNISSLSIRRPVLAIVMNLTILLFGIIGFKSLGVREFPSIDPPIITVRTGYSGANAEIIESQITEPLEKGINGIAGINSRFRHKRIIVGDVFKNYHTVILGMQVFFHYNL